MMMMDTIRSFLRDERASITVEVVMVLPILLWGYFGMFVLFEGYRSLSSNVRSSYTISDLLSRELNEVNANYIEGLNDIQDVLTQSPHRTVLRVTTVRYDKDEDEHEMVWSYSTAGQDAVTQAGLDSQIVPHLPSMYDGEFLIVVETWVAFVPFLSVNIETLANNYTDASEHHQIDDYTFGPFYFESIVATRPRFAGQLCWEGGNSCGS